MDEEKKARMENEGFRVEEIAINEHGQMNLLDVWFHRGGIEEFDPLEYFKEKGTQRYVAGLEEEIEGKAATVDQENDAVWVHALVLYHYLGWCEPCVSTWAYHLYHDFVRNDIDNHLESMGSASQVH